MTPATRFRRFQSVLIEWRWHACSLPQCEPRMHHSFGMLASSNYGTAGVFHPCSIEKRIQLKMFTRSSSECHKDAQDMRGPLKDERPGFALDRV